MATRTRPGGSLVVLLSMVVCAIAPRVAFALITGGEGNAPIRDPGWPKGAAAIFNITSRIAWWEGPPLGGGQWHAECRGDARAFSAVLADFAKLDVKSKRIVVHDGVGNSFWLNPNDEPARRDAAKMDWVFMVWQPENWQRLRKLPADLNPTEARDAKDGPPAHIDVYVGGNIKWADVIVPNGIALVDERMQAHGFSAADGVVLEGHITQVETKTPIAGKMQLELIEPQTKGGYRYSAVAEAKADDKGHWLLKHAPVGWLRVVIAADSFVPRVIGYLRIDDQPRWHAYDGELARSAIVAGRLSDDAGQPLADVEVRILNVATNNGTRYESTLNVPVKTGQDGRFRTEQIPIGKATIWVNKPGYCRPGLGQAITTPTEAVNLTMIRAGQIVVTVDFAGKDRPQAFIVNLEPEAGNVVGSYGGAGHIDDKNQMIFKDVPPARYVVYGQPNPGSANQRTDRETIDLKGGQTIEIKLNAK